jgi:NAD(P)-dependent dehydrogenase (short-subunit alcohol dehydrogenase family)
MGRRYAILVSRGNPYESIRALARSDLKRSGIRIDIVSPGPTNTTSLREGFGTHAEEGLAFLAKSPIGRIGEPEEIAATARAWNSWQMAKRRRHNTVCRRHGGRTMNTRDDASSGRRVVAPGRPPVI